jgi:ABC-type Mn2+/Zn2+ transport system permease subunit
VNLFAFDPFEPFRYDFFGRGVAVAVVTGALCGLVGVFVVLRSMSYIGHGLSHAVFGGAAISAVMGASYFVGAGLWGALAALLIGRVSSKRAVGADAAIGVVTTASFAIGLAIQSRSGEVSRTLDTVLFGNVLGVFTRDLVAASLVAIAVTVFVVGHRRELTFVTFDREVAAVSGIAVARLDAVFMIALSATVLVSARVIGALLISAMLVLPAATTRLVTSSITTMLWVSPLLGAVCGGIGMYASWYADVPSGAMITLIGTALFAVAWLVSDTARRRTIAAIDQHVVA